MTVTTGGADGKVLFGGPNDFTSLIAFTAPYTGAYLASIAEFSGQRIEWKLNVSGSTYAVPEPRVMLLVVFGLPAVAIRRRRAVV